MSEQTARQNWETNHSFSERTPRFQFAIDSTSLGEAKSCPRKYYYSIVMGLSPRAESPHLTFGIHLHAAREQYERNKFAGLDHDANVVDCVGTALRATWNRELGRPWLSGHDKKNRATLIQTIIWYLDEMAQNDSLQTIALANGQPAVELSFRFDAGFRVGGEAIVLCGHLDRIASLNDDLYISDIKTSGSEVSAYWAQQFTPGNQFSLYSVAGRVAFGEPVKGAIVDGVQVGVTFARFARHFVPRDESTLEEWLADTKYWVEQMYGWAEREHWPMNDRSCDMYGGCPFKQICARPPAQRDRIIASEYAMRTWDPLVSREV